MAAHAQGSTVVDTTPNQLKQLQPKQRTNQNKRRRSPRKNISDNSSTSSNDTRQSSDSNNNKPRRKRNNTKHGKVPQQRELSPEEKSRYVALDCEMVGTGPGGYKSSLARVTCIDWNGSILLDVHVRQDEPVTDYRTFVSGITPEDLLSETAISIKSCRQSVQDLLHGKVLIGHALKNDMQVLGIHHPWYDTRDTAKYEPFMKVRFENGILWPRKLKDLAKNKLERDIQLPGQAHSPYEDAKAALDLYRKARVKWEKAMDYKINRTNSISAATVTGNAEHHLAQ